MKRLRITFKLRDVREYQETNDKVIDFEVQEIVGNMLDIENTESDTEVQFEDCYWIEYTVEDMTEQQKENILEKVEEFIEVKSIVVETIEL